MLVAVCDNKTPAHDDFVGFASEWTVSVLMQRVIIDYSTYRANKIVFVPALSSSFLVEKSPNLMNNGQHLEMLYILS